MIICIMVCWLAMKTMYAQLWLVVKLMLHLLHGQGTIECGFSVIRQVALIILKRHLLH